MRVQVIQDGETFLGTVEEQTQQQHPVAGLTTRLTVQRDDQVKVFVWPAVDQVTQMAEELPPQTVEGIRDLPAHLAPPPGGYAPMPSDPTVQVVGAAQQTPVMPVRTGSAPPVGSSFAPPVGMPPAAAAAAPAPPPAPVEERFMVQAKRGAPTSYHTRSTCARVPSDAKTLPVNDDQIEFFGLSVCLVCDKRDAQISWREVVLEVVSTPVPVSEAMPDKLTDRIVKALTDHGFRVTPEMVDRPETEEPS